MSDSQFSQVGILNETDARINPATEESLQAIAGLVSDAYDYIEATYPTTSSEVYTYKNGGSGGTTVATITVVYTDATKEVLTSVTKT